MGIIAFADNLESRLTNTESERARIISIDSGLLVSGRFGEIQIRPRSIVLGGASNRLIHTEGVEEILQGIEGETALVEYTVFDRTPRRISRKGKGVLLAQEYAAEREVYKQEQEYLMGYNGVSAARSAINKNLNFFPGQVVTLKALAGSMFSFFSTHYTNETRLSICRRMGMTGETLAEIFVDYKIEEVLKQAGIENTKILRIKSLIGMKLPYDKDRELSYAELLKVFRTKNPSKLAYISRETPEFLIRKGSLSMTAQAAACRLLTTRGPFSDEVLLEIFREDLGMKGSNLAQIFTDHNLGEALLDTYHHDPLKVDALKARIGIKLTYAQDRGFLPQTIKNLLNLEGSNEYRSFKTRFSNLLGDVELNYENLALYLVASDEKDGRETLRVLRNLGLKRESVNDIVRDNGFLSKLREYLKPGDYEAVESRYGPLEETVIESPKKKTKKIKQKRKRGRPKKKETEEAPEPEPEVQEAALEDAIMNDEDAEDDEPLETDLDEIESDEPIIERYKGFDSRLYVKSGELIDVFGGFYTRITGTKEFRKLPKYNEGEYYNMLDIANLQEKGGLFSIALRLLCAYACQQIGGRPLMLEPEKRYTLQEASIIAGRNLTLNGHFDNGVVSGKQVINYLAKEAAAKSHQD